MAENISKQLDDVMDDIVNPEHDEVERKPIRQISDDTLIIDETTYKVVVDHEGGFNFEGFYDRYQPYFARFDFIVGDWAFEQLRLRGFYQINTRRVPREQTIDHLDDYIKEYCNFGAPYFVIAKEAALDKYSEELLKRNERRDISSRGGKASSRRQISTKQNRKQSKSNFNKKSKQSKFKQTERRKSKKINRTSNDKKQVVNTKSQGFIIKER